MSDNTKLRPEDLTAEERALWDQIAVGAWLGHPAMMDGVNFADSFDAADRFIFARRALFAPATEKAVCPNCKEETGENHVSSYNRDSFTCQPATEKVHGSAFPVGNCPACGDLVAPYNKHAKYEGGYTCQPAQPEPDVRIQTMEEAMEESLRMVRGEPAAQGEMPEAVRNASRALHRAAGFYQIEAQPVDSIMRLVEAANALESFWRTHSQPAADEHYRKNIAERIGMNPDDFNGVPGLCDIETFVFEHDCKARQQAAQPAPADSRQDRADQIKSFLGGDDDEPAQLEPAAQGEMPDEVDRACDLLEWSGNVNAAAALRDAWLAHSQPVAVGMTEELRLLLEKVDDAVTYRLQHGSLEEAHILTELAAAVRQQAAQGKPKVELPKVPVDALKRACATCSLDDCMTIAGWLDAVEGRK